MGKRRKRRNRNKILIYTGLIILLILLSILALLIRENKKEDKKENAPVRDEQIADTEIPVEETKEYTLRDGLVVSEPAHYAGIYMEDGTDEVVEDVMMVILTNTNKKDLQLVRLHIKYKDYVAEFEASNLPAGESVVLLEQNRHEMIEEEPEEIEIVNAVFFEEAMSLQEDRLEIKGLEQSIEIKNISDKDVKGDIYIYYKNSAADLLYGGITYRVRISGGLAASATSSTPTVHFSPDTCRILAVTVNESSGE